MKTLLWLDDVRDPHKDDWLNFSPIERPYKVVWVKSFAAFRDWIVNNGLPDAICFDHDLADVKEVVGSNLVTASDWTKEATGLDCAKFLVSYCLETNSELPKYNIQSANPVGKENINACLQSYRRYRSK